MTRNLRTIAPTLACLTAFAALAAAPGPARADFAATLSAAVTAEAGGTYLYEYTLQVSAGSTAPAIFLGLVVGEGADLQDVAAPDGWFVEYAAGDAAISFFADEPGSPIAPGASGLFAFRSRLAPATSDYTLAGFESGTPEVLEGTIAAPAVPEPSGLALLAAALPAALLARARSRR